MCIRFKLGLGGETKCAWPDCVSSSERRYCEYIQHSWRECGLPEIEPEQSMAKQVADELEMSPQRYSKEDPAD